MSKEKNTFKEAKAPKTVQVKLLVPYAIIISIVIALGGIATGWIAKSNDEARVNAAVSSQVSQLKAQK